MILRREHAADGQLLGRRPASGNDAGKLDAAACRSALQGNELVGAGYENVAVIPPPLGSGIDDRARRHGKGKVTGTVVNGTESLACGSRCIDLGADPLRRGPRARPPP